MHGIVRAHVDDWSQYTEDVVQKADVCNAYHEPADTGENECLKRHRKAREHEQLGDRVRHQEDDVSDWKPDQARRDALDEKLIILHLTAVHTGLPGGGVQVDLNTTADSESAPQSQKDDGVQDGTGDGGQKDGEEVVEEHRLGVVWANATGNARNTVETRFEER